MPKYYMVTEGRVRKMLITHLKLYTPVHIRAVARGGRPPPPFWGQKIFLLVPLFWKLIKLELLYFKLLCSSKIVDFTPIF